MKISKFSELSGLPLATIRYYVKLGLLLPHMNGSMLDFTQREVEELQYIQFLKNVGFSLRDIQGILSIKNISNWVEPDAVEEYVYMLTQRQQELEQEISDRREASQLIADEIRRVSKYQDAEKTKLGVPVCALPYLVCPFCGTPLGIENAAMTYKYISSGSLACHCGYSAVIEDGVLITPNRYTGEYDRPDVTRQLFRNMPDDLHYYFRVCSDMILSEMRSLPKPPKVVLEACLNGYFFFYKHLKELSPDCLYIFIDKFPEMVTMYKTLIERLSLELNILFIADASTNFPIRQGCVDLAVSFLDENEHMLYHENTFFEDTQKYYGPDCSIFGACMAYQKHSRSVANIHKKYPECSSNSHIFDFIKRSYSSISDKEFTSKMVGEVYESHNDYSFSCHVTGEPLQTYYFSLK